MRALCRLVELNTALCLRIEYEKNKILNILFPRVGIESTTCRVYSYTLYPCAITGLLIINRLFYSAFYYLLLQRQHKYIFCDCLTNKCVIVSATTASLIRTWRTLWLPLPSTYTAICGIQCEEKKNSTKQLIFCPRV